MDANLAQLVDPEFLQLLTDCRLYDIISSQHSTSSGNPIATHVDGNRLDFIAGTKTVLENSIANGTLSHLNLANSDHSGGYIDFDIILFGKNLTQRHLP